MSDESTGTAAAANSEAAMIVLYMLCLHRDTLRHVVEDTVAPCPKDIPLLNKLKDHYPHVLTAFRALHNPYHLTAIENMFESFGRDFLLTRMHSNSLLAASAASAASAAQPKNDYDDPNLCPFPDNLNPLLS